MSNYFYLLLLLGLFACDEDEVAEAFPTATVTDITQPEGDSDGAVTLLVRLDQTFRSPVRMQYETRNGTAVAGQDFEAVSGTLQVDPGATQAELMVRILGDTINEGDETFEIVFSRPYNTTLETSVATIRLLNDDTQGGGSTGGDGYTTPLDYPGYTLVWNDEFDGTTLNTADWTYEIGTGASGWGNNELQYYTDRTDNVFLADGKLNIEARSESFAGSNYTSGRIKTQAKRSFQYGRIDIRAKTPETQGLWPALWMLGEDISSVGWPACGEIDIMELRGQEPDQVIGTAHFGEQNQGFSYFKSGIYVKPDGPNFAEQFHVFSIIWTQDLIEWYVDDQLYHSITPSDLDGNVWRFNDDFFFLFNVAVGGNFLGDPDATTVFPQRMVVDYVRVFQQ